MDKNDLISRAALLKECAECQKTDPHFEERGWANHFINSAGEPSTEWYCVEDMIENAPAVDAVPVVRCKNCKYWEADWKPNNVQDGVHFCPMVSLVRRGDWFCADGKRRSETK